VLKVLVFMPVLGAALIAVLPLRALWLWRVAMLFTVAALASRYGDRL